jgi:arylsulfatase A-like enzyme
MMLPKKLQFLSISVILVILVGLIALPPLIKSSFAATIAIQTKRPNFLVIMADDFGYSDIGPFGSEIKTPNLDAIAKDGKILTDYHTAPTCSPARLSLLTGVDYHIGGIGTMYELIAPNQVGKPGYETYIDNNVATIAELLRAAGYHTYLSGKWHLSGNGITPGTDPFERGFEHSLTLLEDGANHFSSAEYIPGWKVTFMEDGKQVARPGNGTLYDADMFTDKLLSYLNQSRADGKPFFAYLATQVAHTPFQAPRNNIEKYYDMYRSLGWDKIREQRFEKQKELGIWPSNMSLPVPHLPPLQPWNTLSPDQKNFAAKILAVHAAMIENLDKNIGRVVQYLKNTGQYDNTFIVFTSDNGTSEPFEMAQFKYASGVDLARAKQFVSTQNNSLQNLGNQNSDVNYGPWGSYVASSPFSGFKGSFYEGGIRIPFVVKLTKSASSIPSPSNIVKGYAFVSDIAPTIYQIANITYPATYNGHPIHPLMGKSLVPLVQGKVDQVHPASEPLGAELFNSTAARMGDWQAIHISGNTSSNIYPNGTDVWMLYNLVSDPGEQKNVAAQHPDILQKMIAAYSQFAKNVGVVIPRGQAYANSAANLLPPIDLRNPVSIDLKQIPAIPGISHNVTATYQNQTKASAPLPQT